MTKHCRNEVEILKTEASRYWEENSYANNEVTKLSGLNNFINKMRPSQRAGAIAMAIGFPGLTPIVLFGGTDTLPFLTFYICLALVVLSGPFWVLAGRLESSESLKRAKDLK